MKCKEWNERNEKIFSGQTRIVDAPTRKQPHKISNCISGCGMSYRRPKRARQRTFHGRRITIHIGNPHAVRRNPFNDDTSGCTCGERCPVYVPSEPERIRQRSIKGFSLPGEPLLTRWLVEDLEGGRVLWVWE